MKRTGAQYPLLQLYCNAADFHLADEPMDLGSLDPTYLEISELYLYFERCFKCL